MVKRYTPIWRFLWPTLSRSADHPCVIFSIVSLDVRETSWIGCCFLREQGDPSRKGRTKDHNYYMAVRRLFRTHTHTHTHLYPPTHTHTHTLNRSDHIWWSFVVPRRAWDGIFHVRPTRASWGGDGDCMKWEATCTYEHAYTWSTVSRQARSLSVQVLFT